MTDLLPNNILIIDILCKLGVVKKPSEQKVGGRGYTSTNCVRGLFNLTYFKYTRTEQVKRQ